MVRFVHTADWQLGMRRHFLDADAQGRFTQGRLDAVAAVGRLAAEVDASFVVVAGDVFEDNQVDRRTLLQAFDVLSGYPDIPVVLLPGNHDPLDAGSVYRRPEFEGGRCPRQVCVLWDCEPVDLAPGVQVVGAPWWSKHPEENTVREAVAALEPAAGLVRVLLAHGACDAVVQDAGQPGLLALPVLESAVDAGRVSYVALGDRHSATALGDTGRVWYSGAPEPTSYVERDPGKALVVDVDEGRVDVQAHQVGRWCFRQDVFEVAGPQDVERVARWLDEPADKPRTIAKLALRGTLSLRDRADLDARLADAAQTYAALEQWDRHTDLVTTPDDTDLEALEIGGFVSTSIDELRSLAQEGGSQAPAANDALDLLYRLVVKS